MSAIKDFRRAAVGISKSYGRGAVEYPYAAFMMDDAASVYCQAIALGGGNPGEMEEVFSICAKFHLAAVKREDTILVAAKEIINGLAEAYFDNPEKISAVREIGAEIFTQELSSQPDL